MSAFSYHGFRYAAITGMKNARKEDFTAYTVSDEAFGSRFGVAPYRLSCA